MLIALALGQELASGVTAPKLKYDQIEVPITTPAAEIVHGLLERPLNFLLLLVDNERRTWETQGARPNFWENTQVGTFSSKVIPGLYGSTPCKVVEVKATRTQLILSRRQEEIGYRYRATRNWFVDAKGQVLGEDYHFQSDHGIWAFNLKWNDDETYTVVLEDPVLGKRTLGPVSPGQDVKELRENMFKPMLTLPKDFTSKEKKFWWYDPWKGGFTPASATYYDTFDGKYWNKQWKGARVDIKGVHPSKFRAYVTEGGWYLRADLDQWLYFHREDQPFDNR